jgi:hypothetical protein
MRAVMWGEGAGDGVLSDGRVVNMGVGCNGRVYCLSHSPYGT